MCRRFDGRGLCRWISIEEIDDAKVGVGFCSSQRSFNGSVALFDKVGCVKAYTMVSC